MKYSTPFLLLLMACGSEESSGEDVLKTLYCNEDMDQNKIKDDADCDGVLTADDCDDNDPNTVSDMDCDGVLTIDDCDDDNADLLTISGDADCDGTVTADDCDDNDALSTNIYEDTDCDGSVEPFYLDSNGITIKCPLARYGDTAEINGITYTKQNRGELDYLLYTGDWTSIENSCTTGITNMSDMFLDISSFNGDIGSWDTSNVTNMSGMFQDAESFNQNISDWDVSYVMYMSGMFSNASSFNEDIGDWDVSSVTSMLVMFYNASSFNQDLSDWCVSNISSEPEDFNTGADNWSAPSPIWGSCSP